MFMCKNTKITLLFKVGLKTHLSRATEKYNYYIYYRKLLSKHKTTATVENYCYSSTLKLPSEQENYLHNSTLKLQSEQETVILVVN